MLFRSWGQLAAGLSRTLRRLGTGRALVTDKLPTNFTQLGSVLRLLPNTAVIHCRRHPLDTCLSNFIQYFTEGHLYSYDLEDTAHFYGLYRRLMAHWEAVLPVPFLSIDYESVVHDVEGEARRLIEHLELPWHDECARPAGATRAVATASNWQVRQPVYQDAARRWERYGDLLDPLRRALQAEVPNIEL